MIVSELLATITADANYVANSLVLKSFDDVGATYKWLFRNPTGTAAYRREIFIATSGASDLEARTVVDNIEVIPAE